MVIFPGCGATSCPGSASLRKDQASFCCFTPTPRSPSPDDPKMLEGLLPNGTCRRCSSSGSGHRGALRAVERLEGQGQGWTSPGRPRTLGDPGSPQEGGDGLVHVSSWCPLQVGERRALIPAHDLADAKQSQASPRSRKGPSRVRREGPEVGGRQGYLKSES